MALKAKKKRLRTIYDRFERESQPFKEEAICKVGCTYCCTDVGNVDTITLEGLVIWERVNNFPESLKQRIKKKIALNRLDKEQSKIARCPFLKTDDTCLIYEIRPFSCRQLYSLKECRGKGPTVHRQAVELAKATVRELQQMDDTGYSGHLTFILHLFERAEFSKSYLSGGFDPGQIAAFGKAHGLTINRFTSTQGRDSKAT
jgi:Fe-S-cluster containining protein